MIGFFLLAQLSDLTFRTKLLVMHKHLPPLLYLLRVLFPFVLSQFHVRVFLKDTVYGIKFLMTFWEMSSVPRRSRGIYKYFKIWKRVVSNTIIMRFGLTCNKMQTHRWSAKNIVHSQMELLCLEYLLLYINHNTGNCFKFNGYLRVA